MERDIFQDMLQSEHPIFEAQDADGHEYKIYLNGVVEGFKHDTKLTKWFIPLAKMLCAYANQKSKSSWPPQSTATKALSGFSQRSALPSTSAAK